ncbi:hypothetical protein Vafri_8057, partial [Volvox africanus]
MRSSGSAADPLRRGFRLAEEASADCKLATLLLPSGSMSLLLLLSPATSAVRPDTPNRTSPDSSKAARSPAAAAWAVLDAAYQLPEGQRGPPEPGPIAPILMSP